MSSPISTEAFFKAIVDSSRDAILSINLSGQITSWNKGAERIFGYEAHEVTGQSVSILYPPERYDEERAILGRIARGETIEHYETVRKRRNSSLVEISLTISPILGADGKIVGASKIARDITEQRRHDLVARQFAAIVEGSDDAIISKDLSGTITSWNRGAERVFGYTESEMIGKPILVLLPLERAGEEQQILSRLQHGMKVDHFLTERVRKDGKRIHVSLTISPIRDSAGTIVGASKIARDVTIEREARAQLADHARELELKVQERTMDLEESVAELEAFSYSLSHDMRASVRTIHSMTELTIEDFSSKIPDTALGYLKIVLASASRLDRLVKDVLLFIEFSRSDLSLSAVDLNKVMEEILIERTDFRDIGAEITVARSLSPVIGHEASLTQCLSNLLSNAVKFVAPGKTPKVSLETEIRGDYVRIKIIDSGVGIDPAHQQNLFKLFRRGDSSVAYAGTGVGLAIVKKAIARMRGRVGVDSSLGLGSTFWLELPKA